MTYDEAIKRLHEITREVEQNEAISMEVYRQKYQEAQKLIAFCREQLDIVEEETKKILGKI